MTGRDGTGEEIRERGKVCRHTEGLARRPKRITEFVFSWTITGAVPSSPFSCLLSSSLSVPLLIPVLHPRPPAPAPGSFSFYLRNETQWPLCAAQSFDGNFFVKAHCHLSRSLIRRTYRSSGEKCLRPRDGALFARARDTAGASVFITAVVLNAGQYHPANLIYLKHSQSDHRELLVELIDGGLIKRVRKGKSE